jgi:pyruvate kinase
MSEPIFVHLDDALDELRAAALAQEQALGAELAALAPAHRAAGRNLAHYLGVRQHDIRDLQRDLIPLGLSSLGRMEPCVLATLNAVSHALACLAGLPAKAQHQSSLPTVFGTAEQQLHANTGALLGPKPQAREARIMVTLALDSGVGQLEELLAEGADVLRINCSKGDPDVWRALIERVRHAERKLGKTCRILCDLEGPNPRSLSFEPEPDGDVIARIGIGDRLLLARRKLEKPRSAGAVAAVLGCTLPEIIDDLKQGERIFYDDGKLAGVIETVTDQGALVRIDFARKGRVKLRPHKGLNFPDSTLRLPALTAKDLSNLEFIVAHADLVGQSFVRSPEDVEGLQRALSRLGATEFGIVLKIETTQAFLALPRILFVAMRSANVGVMVARGDMAMELGFERLAEAQEEILWLCEAAFVPVIWATQVLDTLAKTGMPSRAEVTDAAMSGRAECVMLNQGEHVADALRFLRRVLERMQEHQEKKRSMLRRLRISTLS